MTRLVALVIVALVVVYCYQRARLVIARARADLASAQRSHRGAPATTPIQLVACPICGVRVAADLAVTAVDGSGRQYCSATCRPSGP